MRRIFSLLFSSFLLLTACQPTSPTAPSATADTVSTTAATVLASVQSTTSITVTTAVTTQATSIDAKPTSATSSTTISAITTTAVPNNSYTPPTKVKLVQEAFSKETFVTNAGFTLPYRLYVPDGYSGKNRYPVFLYLHGAGERGTDNVKQLWHYIQPLFNSVASPMYGAIVVAPQCPLDQQWVNVPWKNGNYDFDSTPISEALAAVLELLDDINKRYATDVDRCYVSGLSMGGFGTWDICMRDPDRFAAAVPLCGASDHKKASLIKHIPIRTYHGSSDDTVPVSGTKRMVKALEKVGADIYFDELSGVNHNAWDYAAADSKMLPWLFSQKRKS